MFIFKEKKALRSFLDSKDVAAKSLGFIPTMGALHQGHLALLQQSISRNPLSVVSVFVNPTQFNRAEDLQKYPRLAEADIELLEAAGCTALFMPAVEEMYPGGTALKNAPEPGPMAHQLEGASRPGHFEGVVQVVDLLLELIRPDELFVGQKDYQQCLVLNKLLEDRYPQIRLIMVPTLREPDGLAMSSRNRYLTPEQRAVAPQIFAALERARRAIESGRRDFAEIEREGMGMLEAAGFRPDYFSVRDANTLAPPSDESEELVVLTAARIGRARLIDNVRAKRPR